APRPQGFDPASYPTKRPSPTPGPALILIDDVGAAASTGTGSPSITQITFPACRAQYPGGPNRCVSVSSLSARPSPVNRRVGIHDFTFGACSSFTRVTACKVARPPKGGLLSRGFDPASYPTKPLGSYHVLPTTTWMDPPSTGDLRRWGAPLNNGYTQKRKRRLWAVRSVVTGVSA